MGGSSSSKQAYETKSSYLDGQQRRPVVGRVLDVGQDERVEVHGGLVAPERQDVALLSAAVGPLVLVVLVLAISGFGHFRIRREFRRKPEKTFY